MLSERDHYLMRLCVDLARQAEARTTPNPVVGSVITTPAGDRIIGSGWHVRAGMPHAEAAALASATESVVGATLYVNLEPCSHLHHRRTSPCVPRIIEAGIARVVFGAADTYPGHGGGAEQLRQAGIEVEGPLEETLCRWVNAPFLSRVERGRPHFVTTNASDRARGRRCDVAFVSNREQARRALNAERVASVEASADSGFVVRAPWCQTVELGSLEQLTNWLNESDLQSVLVLDAHLRRHLERSELIDEVD
jgi:pyrimidine deaminase RibD-like protein